MLATILARAAAAKLDSSLSFAQEFSQTPDPLDSPQELSPWQSPRAPQPPESSFSEPSDPHSKRDVFSSISAIKQTLLFFRLKKSGVYYAPYMDYKRNGPCHNKRVQ